MCADPLHTPEQDADADALIARYARRARQKNILAVLLALLATLGIGWLLVGKSITRAVRRASLEVSSRERLASMSSMERVHAELLPSWTISASNDSPENPEDFELLMQALKEDPDASSLLEDLREQIADRERLPERGDEILETIKLWNRLMDRAETPWWVDGNVLISPKRSFFYLKTYKILADFSVTVGEDHTYRTRMAARMDHTNIVESFLGHTSPNQDGAIILSDRLYDVSLREIWPLLARELHQGATAREALFKPFILREARALLPSEALAMLQTHAPARAQLERALRQIRERRACGSTFMIRDLPWNGFPQEQVERLRSYADRDRYADCPSIKEEEIAIIAESSELLANDQDLQRAAENLVAHVARAITVHEARHAADHELASAFTQPIPCALCDTHRMSRATRAELSAYLATFADDHLAYTGLYQACGLDLARGTPHARALSVVLPMLEVDCEKRLPEDLSARARALEQEFFGRSDRVTLPADYPAALELYR